MIIPRKTALIRVNLLSAADRARWSFTLLTLNWSQLCSASFVTLSPHPSVTLGPFETAAL